MHLIFTNNIIFITLCSPFPIICTRYVYIFLNFMIVSTDLCFFSSFTWPELNIRLWKLLMLTNKCFNERSWNCLDYFFFFFPVEDCAGQMISELVAVNNKFRASNRWLKEEDKLQQEMLCSQQSSQAIQRKEILSKSQIIMYYNILLCWKIIIMVSIWLWLNNWHRPKIRLLGH